MNRKSVTSILILLVLCAGCHQKTGTSPEFYTMEDFASLDKIDAHIHINEGPAWLLKAREDKIRLLTLNTSLKQRDRAYGQIQAFPDRLAYATTFSP